MKNILFKTLIILTIILSFGFTGCSSMPQSFQSTPFEGNFSGISGDGFMEMIFTGNILEVRVNGVSSARGSFTYTDNELIWNLTHACIPRKSSMARSGVFEVMLIPDDQYRWIKIPLAKIITTWNYKLEGEQLFLSDYKSATSFMGTSEIVSFSGAFPALTKNSPVTDAVNIWEQTAPYAKTIAAGYKGYGGNVQIPGIIQDTPLISIGPSSFNGCGITQISIPSNVRFIELEAFSLNQLTKVDIPDNVLLVGNKAFYKNLISELTIGESVLVIGAGAFADNPIRKITIKNPHVFIFDTAFDNGFKTVFLEYGIGVYSYVDGVWIFEG